MLTELDENQQLSQNIIQMLEEIDKDSTYERRKFIKKITDSYEQFEQKKNGKYTQDWQAYNRAQMREKIFIMNILDELLCYIPFPERNGVGKKPISFRDKIFYLVLQAYNIKSSRRCIADLEIARRLKFVTRTPHFNTVLKCLKDSSLIPYLKHLIQVSGMPLQQVESDFAVDSSGFSTSLFGRWFDARTGNESEKRKYVKIHLTCGVKSNIITAVNITKGNFGDSPQFEGLIKDTDKIYNIREVSADKAYSSRKNLQLVSDLGGIPFIPFKRNIKATSRARRSGIWKKMLLLFSSHIDEFNHHYHKRSNSETCFHMLKRKFGSHLRSRTETGQANEILAKCLAHNLCVLVQEAFEIGIILDFQKCADIQIAHN